MKSIAQRGICMVATAHGLDLNSLLKNPDLSPLLGGLQTVTLGDQLAKCVPLSRVFDNQRDIQCHKEVVISTAIATSCDIPGTRVNNWTPSNNLSNVTSSDFINKFHLIVYRLL